MPAQLARAMGSMNEAATRDVVHRAQRGDLAAFEQLYHAHAAAVYALCRRMTRDQEQAKDLLQDVFVRAWERLPSFKGQSALSTWLHRLAVNVVLEDARTTQRLALRFTETDDEIPAAHSAEVRGDIRIDVDAALGRLPDGARTVFVLHDVYGYSHDEIAQLTGMAASTARVQLWRARQTLMKLLDL